MYLYKRNSNNKEFSLTCNKKDMGNNTITLDSSLLRLMCGSAAFAQTARFIESMKADSLCVKEIHTNCSKTNS